MALVALFLFLAAAAATCPATDALPPRATEAAKEGVAVETGAPAPAGLVVGGTGITRGGGLLGSLVYLDQAQVRRIKAEKGAAAFGLGDSWTGRPALYSSYDNHGQPEYVYRLAEGIDLRKALTALGVDVHTAPVALSVTGADGYTKTVEDAFGLAGPRRYIAPDGRSGAAVDPILIFHEGKVETAAPEPGLALPSSTAAMPDPNPLFAFGQREALEQTNCSFVRNAVKIRVGADAPAFTVTAGDTVQSISLSDIAILGIGRTSYRWDGDPGSPAPHQVTGIPLARLLARLGVAVSPSQRLVIRVRAGGETANSPRVIGHSEIDGCFVAFDAFENGRRVTGCRTPLRIYCPGQTRDRVMIPDVVGATVGEAGPARALPPGQAALPGKEPGGDVRRAVFYIAVRDVSGETKFYYYTAEELRSHQTQQSYTYNDHGVAKTATCRGSLLSDLLDELRGVALTGDMVVQYAEEDAYHADAETSIENSSYKDTVRSLTCSSVGGDGSTQRPRRSLVTESIHEEFAAPGANRVNDSPGSFRPAEKGGGPMRVYRDTGDANSSVLKYVLGVAVSRDGRLLSGRHGCVVACLGEKPPPTRLAKDKTVLGLLPGMAYAVKAPDIPSASPVATAAHPNPAVITVGNGSPAETTVTFRYAESTFFYVKNTAANSTSTHTLRDLRDRQAQVPPAGAPGAPYGYSRPMYYRYQGVWLRTLAGPVPARGHVRLVGPDGARTDVTDRLDRCFLAFGRTQSKSSTNIPEGKRVTVDFDRARVVLPDSGETVPGSGPEDFSPAGRDVTVLQEAVDGLEISE